MLNKYIDLTGLEHFVDNYLTDIVVDTDKKHAVSSKGVIDYVEGVSSSMESSVATQITQLQESLKNYLPLTGGTLTGAVIAPSFQTGTDESAYFQTKKMRGQGNASDHKHAVDWGYSGHNSVDFYEYGATWNFYQCQSQAKTGAKLVGSILSTGWNGGAVLSGTPTAPTASKGTNTTQIATTAFVQTALADKVSIVSGKDLSTNDFSDDYKSQVDSNTSARHSHSNKDLLDGITEYLKSASVANGVITLKDNSDNEIVFSSTDTKVTSVENHYVPVQADTFTVTAQSDTSASWDDTSIVTGVSIGKDDAGHITSLSIDSVKMPSNPDTWRDIKINSVSIENDTLNLIQDGSTTISNADGEVTISSTDSKVTSADNHYTPVESASYEVNADSEVIATWGGTSVLTGLSLGKDSAGHITSVTANSVKLPPNTNTWRDIQIEDSSIEDNVLNLKCGSNVSLTNTDGVVTIESSYTDTTYDVATSSTDGLMSSTDKTKLDNIKGYIKSAVVSDNVLTLTDNSNITYTLNDDKVTSVDNHYTPVESASFDVDALSTIPAEWDDTSVVTGITLGKDSAGHITSLSVDSTKMPSNPDTWRDIQVEGTSIEKNILNLKQEGSVTIGNANGVVTISSTDSKVTSADNHYKPVETDSFDATADSDTIATWGDTAVLTGISLGKDSAGHITSISANATKIPSNPNTWRDIKVKGASIDNNTLNLVAGDNVSLSNTDGEVTISSQCSNTEYTFSEGSSNGTFTVTPSNGTAKSVAIKGLGSLAYRNSLSYSDVNALPETTTYIKNAYVLDNVLTITPSSGNSFTFKGSGDYTVATQSADGLMSSSDKIKLDGIDTGAEVNAIETVKVNGTALTPSSKAVDITVPTKISQLSNDSNFVTKATTLSGYGITDVYTKTEIDNKLASSMKYMGQKDTYNDLPESNNNTGDVWDVKSDGHNYAWNGTSWDDLGGTVDLSNYYTKTTTNSLLDAKADKATTLSGYGITDASISSGKITLGSNSITPLTSVPTASASTLGGIKVGSNLSITSGTLSVPVTDKGATLSYGNTSAIATVGSTDINVTMPAQYSHPTATSASNGLYKITVNGLGHVTSTTAVSKSDIIALGIPSADTNTWRAISVDGTTKIDSSTSTAIDFVSGNNVDLSYDSGKLTISATDTTYSGSSGITVSSGIIGHSNSVTGKTISGSSGNASHGGKITIPSITYDNYGHITGTTTTTVTLPADNNTTYTFATGTTNGTFNVTPSGGTVTSVPICGLGSLAYKSSLIASDIPTIASSKVSGLATVATSGSYNDLSNQPSIPTVATSYSTTGTTAFTAKSLATDSAVSALLNCLSTGSATPTDNDYYIAQYAGGGTTTTSYHRRPVSALYSYMKGKMDSVYSPKAGSSSITTIGTLSSGTVPVARISGLGTLATKNSLSASDVGALSSSTAYVKSASVSGSTLTLTPSSGDAVTFTNTNTVTAIASTTGSGNAVTAISASGGQLTVTKGTTFLTSHQSVTNKSATLSWGNSSTIATIGSTNITVSLPANPNTDTTYNSATYNTLGLLKPLKNYTSMAVSGVTASADTTTTTAKSINSITATAGRYYAIEVDKNGVPFVNVPWTDKNTTYSVFSTSANGLVPKPSASNTTTYLNASGTWTTPPDTNTDTKCTAVGNHYTPTTDSSSILTSTANATTTATWGSSSFVSGVTINRDACGHVTGISTSSLKMPALTSITQLGNILTATSFTNTTESTSTTSGAVKISGGLGVAGNIYGTKVYNAVWNDLADCIEVDKDCNLEAGYCYCFDGKHYYKSDKYLADGIIGIHSDTYGMNMGRKDVEKQMDIAVAGFVLAYVDKDYKAGTPLTCTKDGRLTKIKLIDRIFNPHKIVATYWKKELANEWGSEKRKVKVNGRKWVKIK